MDAFIPGFLLTIIGMGVVFGSLIALMAVIMLLEKVLRLGKRGNRRGRRGAETLA